MNADAPPTVWLTIAAAADRAAVSAPTVRRAIDRGLLAAFRVRPGNRIIRVRAADVDAWIERGERDEGQETTAEGDGRDAAEAVRGPAPRVGAVEGEPRRGARGEGGGQR
jgi:excisionase family DNA binding protein